MTRRAFPVALAAAALLLAGCGGSDLSKADARACDALEQFGDSAVDGHPDAIRALADKFGTTRTASLSSGLEAQAVRVGGSAYLESSGTEADLPQFIGQMHKECVTLGWKA